MKSDGFFIVDPFSDSAVEKAKQVNFSSCKKYGSEFCHESGQTVGRLPETRKSVFFYIRI